MHPVIERARWPLDRAAGEGHQRMPSDYEYVRPPEG